MNNLLVILQIVFRIVCIILLCFQELKMSFLRLFYLEKCLLFPLILHNLRVRFTTYKIISENFKKIVEKFFRKSVHLFFKNNLKS